MAIRMMRFVPHYILQSFLCLCVHVGCGELANRINHLT